MTHTLHRAGDQSTLRQDYVILATAAQPQSAEGLEERFRRFSEICLKHGPVNFGDMTSGNRFSVGEEAIHAGYCEGSIVHFVFTDEDVVAAVLEELKRAELGLSIVVSGLMEHTAACCRRAGLVPHTAAVSLGVLGRTDRLPRDAVLWVHTMCGHGMIAFSLIEAMVSRIREGSASPQEAARELAKQCHCGVFNPERAEGLLRAMADGAAPEYRRRSSEEAGP